MESVASFKGESNMETLEKLINQVKRALNVTHMITHIIYFYIISITKARFVVAHWWWMNMHDDECTAGAEIDSWVKDIPDNVYDEINQVSDLPYLNSAGQFAESNLKNQSQSEHLGQQAKADPGKRKHQHVYVWNPSQNL